MTHTFRNHRAELAQAGLHFPDEVKFYDGLESGPIAHDAAIQASLITQVNAGIPAWLSNIIDPKIIEVMLAPMKAAEITGEKGIGNWTIQSTQFPLMEYAGEVSSYGDYNNNGSSSANVNWIDRQQYIYQGICNWGDQEIARYGLAKIDYANSVRKARGVAFARFQNKSYFFGISNLRNYGLLNDPALYPAITPTTKTAGGTSWAVAKPEEILQDITNLFHQLVLQTNELVDSNTPMKLCLSGVPASYMNNTNQFGLSVKAKLKEIYPKLEIITAPEYNTSAGELVQLIAPEVMGQEVLCSYFGDKLRAFPLFRDLSSFRQKFEAGTWGCIIKFPPGIAQMLGI